MKRFSNLGILLLIVCFVLSACGGTSDSSKGGDSGTSSDSGNDGKTFTFKVGHSLTKDHPYQVSLEQFAKNVEKRTDGKVKFEIYPLSQLGAERECTESLTVGTVDMCLSSTAPLVNFYKPIGVLDLPFLFDSREQAYKVLDGEVGEKLFKGLKEKGIIGLAWGENGFRHITNSKRDIKSPDDLEGLKIRVQESPIILDTFEALGAQPTPMAWDEALTALQQSVVDAQENPVTVAVNYKLYEANQTHMTLTGHIYSAAAYLFSQISWDKLPEEYQKIIKDEAKKAGDLERQLIADNVKKGIETLKKNGVKVIEDVDKEPFRKAVKPVYDEYGKQYGDLLEQIQNTQ